jgi:glutamate dehydrogenase
MPSDSSSPQETLLARLETLAEERFSEGRAGLPARFLRIYYSRVRLDLLQSRALLDLYGAALAHLGLARRRDPEETVLRVYNPTLESDGWECPHTVVQTVIEDMPFLVDSVRMAINRRGLSVIRIIHPIVGAERDAQGHLLDLSDRNHCAPPAPGASAVCEAFMHFEIVRQTDPGLLAELREELMAVLEDVRRAVIDWGPMREALAGAIGAVESRPPPVDVDETAEYLAFLRWLADEHFTFLGYRLYDLSPEGEEEALAIVPGSGLGILRERTPAGESQAFASLPPHLRAQARAPELLVLVKTTAKATVHRPVNLDYVGIKRFDDEGRVCGEHRFLGLYSSRAYNQLPEDIPLLRRKARRVTERADLVPNGHSAKALAHILRTYPRDELFQISEDDLFRIAGGIMELEEEQRPRLFLRQDPYGRFVTCLVYVARERYDTQVRKRIQQILLDALNGTESEFTVSLSESLMARVLFIVRTRPDALAEYDSKEIEERLAEAVQSWPDRLHAALLEHLGEERGSALMLAYADAFPAGYREDFPARNAVRDIEHMEALGPGSELGLSLYAPLESLPGQLRFKVFRYASPLPLSEALPILENMGVRVDDERPYRVDRRDSPPLWVHDFGLAYEEADEPPDRGEVRDLFQDAFAMAWQGRVEDDGFNRLVLKARLGWRQIALIRALAKYLRQTNMPFSQAYIEQAFAANADIAAMLVELYAIRFDPARQKHAAQQATRLLTRLREALDEVASLDQDRILRSFLAVAQATLRINWFQRGPDGGPKEYLALKLRPADIPDLPQPRPAFEIFVCSPRMEGIHLRGGKVARGGLRWSDRREDFRTEILGLMKAQMVKNAVIVPVGAKGGFVVKRPPAERGALRDEVLACYRQLVGGLLDLTDNLVEDRSVPPEDLIRYDGDDPYLVVAADKGTATFSDTANEVAARYGFWLGDAFASGGATGYDHKAMGITARGAWECVRQHFQASGVDYTRAPFTVVGIGDMSGDVFGNGLLLSPGIKLIAAFDHRHVFIDPDPDPRASFEERRRLFALPTSSWADYDPTLLSAGGGVYPRTLKSVHLSPQACEVLGTRAEILTPADLIRILLRAPVDLLWNGGIGTYVRAAGERDADVGDRGNDAVRIPATALRCKVIGEGGNLGLTQLARVEFARRGGRLDTDFVHNAGGVSCSDHEVNIKILLDRVVAEGDLTVKQRNALLEEMTDEVARLVLKDCYWQCRAVGLDELRAPSLLSEHSRFIRALEQRGALNRALEYLPNEEALAERRSAGEGLTRPELAVVLSYAKHTLYESLLASNLPEDPCLAPELVRYFPRPLRERFPERIRAHRLRREILAASVSNRLLNRMGSTFVFRLQEDLGAAPADVVRAHIVAWEVLAMRRLWSEVAGLDAQVEDRVQREMLSAGARLMARTTRWLLRSREGPIVVSAAIERYRGRVDILAGGLAELVDEGHRALLEETAAPLLEAGVPADLGRWVAGFDPLSRAFDLVEITEASGVEMKEAAQVYFALGSTLDLDWLGGCITALPAEDRWLARARAALRDDLSEHHRALCVAALRDGMAVASPASKLDAWRRQNRRGVEAWLLLVTDLKSQDAPDLAMLSVALRALYRLAASTN